MSDLDKMVANASLQVRGSREAGDTSPASDC